MPADASSGGTQPIALGPYAPAARADHGVLFLSGQVGKQPGSTVVAGDVAEQTRACLANLAAVLGTHGLGLDALVKCNVYLTDMDDFSAMNEAYAGVLGDHRPARTTIGVAALPLGARVEIEAVATPPKR